MLYQTVARYTNVVSPNDVDAPTQKTSTTSTTASQTNNQIKAKNNTTTTQNVVKDKTNNVKSTQTREGRHNK